MKSKVYGNDKAETRKELVHRVYDAGRNIKTVMPPIQ